MAAVADGYANEAPPALVVHAVEPPTTMQVRPAPRITSGASIVVTDSAKDGGSDADQSSDPEPDKEQEDDDVNDENTAPDEASGGDRKPRRELPPATVKILKDWMLSSEHIKHPYPTDDDKKKLLELTGINMKQLTNWFTNARKRIWKPMMRREHSRQLHSSLAVDSAHAAEPASSYTQHPASGSSRGYNEYTHDQGNAPPPHPMMERRLSLPSTSEFDPRYPPPHAHHHHGGQLGSTFPRSSIHPLAATSTPSAYGHPSYQSPLMSYGGYGGLPRISGPSSFFPPRSNRSASESVAHHHSHQHTSHTLSHRVSSSTQPSSQPPLPPRLERTNSDAAKASPPLKRERPGSSSGDLDGEGSDAQQGKDKRLRRSALLPPHVIKTLKDWMLSPEHVEHPYPTDAEKKQLCEDTGLDLCQLNNWFANNRKRLWKPTMANRSKALYTNENIRNLIYKSENEPPVQSNSTAPPSSSSTPTGFKSDRVFHVNASLGRPVAADSGDGPRHDVPATSHMAMPRYPFPGTSLMPGVAPREGRSHTLDMGSFRRSRMNFQDVLNASTTTPRWSPDGHDNSVRREGAGRTLPSLHAPSSSSSAGFH